MFCGQQRTDGFSVLVAKVSLPSGVVMQTSRGSLEMSMPTKVVFPIVLFLRVNVNGAP